MLRIRQAEPGDAAPLARLWARAFPGERTVADRERALEEGLPYGGIESAWLHEQDGHLTAAFRAYPFTQYINGTPLRSMGLAAVAVAAAARRRGLGRQLCVAALRVGRERGDIISALYPFRPAFYRSLGWGIVGGLHAHTFRAGALPDDPARDAVRPAEPDDDEAIMACYARVAERSNGLIRRDARAWKVRLGPWVEGDDAGRITAVVGHDRAAGYMLARSRPARSPEHRTIRIAELVAEDEIAYRSLLAWLAGQRDQWPYVRYDAPRGDALEHRLADPRPPGFRPERGLWFSTARLLRGPMLRVLDVPAALHARRWEDLPGGELGVEIEVLDREIPSNRGPWRLDLHAGGATVRSPDAHRPHARLVTDAPAFAQIYCGELLPSEAARVGLAQVAEASRLDSAFRAVEPFWLLDEF